MDGFMVKPGGKCPADEANCLSELFFWWMRKLFVTGARKDLDMDDMCYPRKTDESELVTEKLERAWNRELEKLKTLEYAPGAKKKKLSETAEPSLCRAIFVVFWWDFFKCGLQIFIMTLMLKTIVPIFQQEVIAYFGGSGSKTVTPKDAALCYAAAIVLTTFAIILVNHHSTLACYQIAMRARVACSALVYSKILKLSKASLGNTTPGQIVNLLSNDINRFDIVGPLLHKLWIMPLQVIMIGTLLYIIVGPITFIGIGSLLLLIVPTQFAVNRYSKRLRRRIAVLSDQRIQFMNELVNGIQVVKLYAWEGAFEKKVSSARFSEMSIIRVANYLRSFNISISIFADKLNVYLILLAYVLMGNMLTAEVAFTIVLYITILQAGSAFVFPQAVLQTGEASVSLRRLQNFLMLDEVVANNSIEEEPNKKNDDRLNATRSSTLVLRSEEHSSGMDETNENANDDETEIEEMPREHGVFLEMQRLSANWKNGQLPPTICDVSLKIYGGELCGLVGKVGSGKTSLLNVILRELPIGAGNLYMRQNFTSDLEAFSQKCGYVTDNPRLVISYASQEPWLFTGTVRDNILFGQPWDSSKYQQVTKVCALWRDIRQWPEGDSTIVGDRGIILSGGQKARVNLARAVYRNADLYLLDDPLSAVDTRVGRHLFKKCINGYLKGKTRILVTHQLQYLKSADTVVFIDRGLVQAQGTFDDLKKSSPDFVTLMSNLERSKEEEKKYSANVPIAAGIDETGFDQSDMSRWDSIASIDSLNMGTCWSDDANISSSNSTQYSEILIKGKMSWNIWKRYLCTGGSSLMTVILIATMLIAQISLTGTDYWISYWCNLEAARASLDNSTIGVTRDEFISYANNTFFVYFSLTDDHGLLTTNSAIYVYTFLVLCCIVFNLARNFMFMGVCVRASYKLHDEMFAKILRATMRFFNLNQSGRILNRFSKDVGTMDELLPYVLLDATRIVLFVCGAFVSVVIADIWMIFPIIVLVILFTRLTGYYLKTAYGIKRLEGVCKSPIFTQVNATLQGLATIRSSGPAVNRILRKQFAVYQDIHSGTWYMIYAASATFSFWLDILACAFVACVCFTPFLFDDDSTMGGTIGLAISQSMALTGTLQYGLKQCIETFTYMTAIERIAEYTNVKTEGSPTSDNPPPPNWPPKGRLSMKNVYMSYTDDNSPVLKDLNLTIEPGWKVGVVGRTGAGKSSLISAIFRLENEGLTGEIKIDGRDTSTLGLEELRSRISIIPQESVLLSGSLRYNLDPTDIYEDAALCDALREVELGALGLDHPVSESGSNFSVGQRQLICLARAILKNNRILILDEATANIDSRTDALIQKTLKTKFARHTLITVAHRLITVVENDRILVMDDGRVSEFGCPYELLCNNPDGPFAEMVRQAGPMVAENLIRLAEAACLEVPAQHSLDLANSNSDDSPQSAIEKE